MSAPGDTCSGLSWYTATAPLDDYRHSDWLGNLRLASQPFQAPPWSETAYAPFGEPYAQAGASHVSFTGMNQDTTLNLYDFPAREYGIQGRWASPDPAGMASVNPADPQTWDRYAYVRNSPLTMTDPTGLDGEGGGSECDPNNASCVPYCGFDCVGGIGPPTQLPNQLTVNVFYGTITPTTGLPSGIFANGPGFDYSWLGLLTWAGIVDSMPGIKNIIGCLNAAGNPVSCIDPSAVIDCDDGATSGELPQVQVPSICYVVFSPPVPELNPTALVSIIPMSRGEKTWDVGMCWLGLEPDVFEPISVDKPRPAGSTDAPQLGQEPPGQEEARELAELIAGLMSHVSDAARCTANVWNWPTK